MLLMHNIDFNLQNENGLKAKDVTESRKILDIIAWYEANMQGNRREERAADIDVDVIEEEKEEDEEVANSSYTPSPTLGGVLADAASQLPDEQREKKKRKEERKSTQLLNEQYSQDVISSLAGADDSERTQSLSPRVDQDHHKNLAYANLAAINNDDLASGEDSKTTKRQVTKPQSKI